MNDARTVAAELRAMAREHYKKLIRLAISEARDENGDVNAVHLVRYLEIIAGGDDDEV